MFRELGEFVTRHPWLVIAAWLIVLVAAAPLAATFEERLTYGIEAFLPSDMDSMHAQDLYDEKFPASSQSELIVAVESENRTAAMAFIGRLNDSVAAGGIKNVTGTMSIYGIHREAMIEASPDLHEGLHDVYASVTDASDELHDAASEVRNASRDMYDLRDNVTKIYSQLWDAWGTAAGISGEMYGARQQIVDANAGMYRMRGVAAVLFGVPAAYADGWIAGAGTSDPELRKAGASAAAASYIGANVPVEYQPMAMGYLQGFNMTWDPAASSPDAHAYADAIIAGGYADGFINANVPADMQPLMLNVRQALDLSAYENPQTLSDTIITSTMVAAGLTGAERPLLTAAYGLGAGPSAAAVDALTLQIITGDMPETDAVAARGLYACGNDWGRIGDYVVGQAVVGQSNSTVIGLIRDAWALGRSATNETFDRYVLDYVGRDVNESDRARLKTIYSWGQSPNATVIRDFVLSEAAKDLNETERKMAAEVYDLGGSPGAARLKAYTVDKANDELKLKGNLSYLSALLGLDPNATDAAVEAFAGQWAGSHDYENPQMLPDAVVGSMAKGDLALYVVELSDESESPGAQESVTELRGTVKSLRGEPAFGEVDAYVTGGAALSHDMEESMMNDINNIDKVSVVLILLLLGLYFRSFLTPFVPLLIIVTAIVICFAALNLLSYGLNLFYMLMTFVIVIMLGAGTDYCVFILTRYSEERSNGHDVRGAIVRAVEHSGKSVASSGATAMIGFGALLLVDRGIFGSIGISVSIGIFISIMAANTLLPAVMTLAGDRIFWPRKLLKPGEGGLTAGLWSRITRGVIKHSKVILALALLISIPAVYLNAQITLSSDDLSGMDPRLESKIGFDAIDHAFGSGAIEDVMVLMVLPGDTKDPSGNVTHDALDRVEQASALVAGIPGVDKVNSMTRPEGTTINYDNLSSYPLIEREYYKSYMDDSLGNDNRTAVIHASFKGSPYSPENARVIDDIRSQLAGYGDKEGIGFFTGGTIVSIHDYQDICTGNYSLVYLVVFVGIFLVLATLLRSIFTPLRLIVTLLMSVFWTMAAYVIAFQFGLGTDTDWILPIFLFCALMGLGVDYDIFLVSRVREEVLKGRTDEQAIEHAVEKTGTIITLCGAVMASAFGSMMLSTSLQLQKFGFVLSLAIILDATVIRLMLVPAIMVLMKKYNWWMPSLAFLRKRPKGGAG